MIIGGKSVFAKYDFYLGVKYDSFVFDRLCGIIHNINNLLKRKPRKCIPYQP